ncbi:MAG: hypothetical protein RL696_493, partial [Actinomycetota bacterium]
MNTVVHWISGSAYTGTSDHRGEVFDPALGRVIRHVSLASQEDVDAVVASSKAAFPKWRDLPMGKRQ